ncbi:SH3 domain-containing protein, partial [Peribacillus muralis]|uniref:SH3 domain-containing protein n=1 Tax=Peribacillus muralis TaxID=264697 RepID=UPI00147074C5
SADSLNMRKSGAESAPVVAKLTRGTSVTVYSESNGWARIKADGKDGYVSTKYLSATKPGVLTKAAVPVSAVSVKTQTNQVTKAAVPVKTV